MNAVTQAPIGRISKCFTDVVAYTVLFKKTCAQKQPGFAEVQNQVKVLLAESAKISRELGIDPRDYDDARFALCAWIDETMMNMPWVHRGEWQRSLLQTELYGTTNAGEEFFDRLNRLNSEQNTIREIYYMCLCLGFMGRYCRPGDEIMLGQLKLSNISALLGTRGTMDFYAREPMFDCAYEDLGKERRSVFPIKQLSNFFSGYIFVIGIPLVILIVIFIVYNFVLDGVKDNLLNYLIGE